MPNVVQEGDRFGQDSVMVWGGISIDGRTDLVVICGNLTAARYIKQTTTGCVGCCIRYGLEFVLMHDNARAHVACIIRAALQELGHSRDGMASSESQP
jgi:hypothetical protein